ncbi:hypothetical protein F3I27_01935 [Pantoea sp. Bo_2]|nr:hypothetical protein F3I57_10365 [Pantoea sp. VH_3]KAA5953122.1 hypothetical protein F3I56_09460 [Pantoea sp. VH_25]KAA5953760.1 hypothetical protein F3I55_15560 [Pantoea sp. VH_24]KAA5959559.1 hypothetical protein F3I53_12825 [Pantoea sp. VH_16]KAA5963309.1 hypothetical protein F3I54_15710 [Pantoea sp. VH_18]KAA5983209.1 hypothetical protein F3I48_08465 [Pantoea sp. M_3]KAA5996679.1 hypothetical protein F3I46_13790 [Pantoea sp. M_1]KAA6005826.1 hypothetical protein F3I45_04320 [Pantoea s
MLLTRIIPLEFHLGTDKPADMDDVHAVVGQAVSSLLKSGKTAGIQEIIAYLKQQEARSVNGQREVYARAVRVVTKLVN